MMALSNAEESTVQVDEHKGKNQRFAEIFEREHGAQIRTRTFGREDSHRFNNDSEPKDNRLLVDNNVESQDQDQLDNQESGDLSI